MILMSEGQAGKMMKVLLHCVNASSALAVTCTVIMQGCMKRLGLALQCHNTAFVVCVFAKKPLIPQMSLLAMQSVKAWPCLATAKNILTFNLVDILACKYSGTVQRRQC